MTVKLDPDAEAVYRAFQLAARPPLDTLTPEHARQLYRQSAAEACPDSLEMASVNDCMIPGPAGDLETRIYTPKKLRQQDGLAPGLVFFHGGGWVAGDLDSHDAVCRCIADSGELIVVAVHYRLAPEHKFPAAVEDAIAAAKWVSFNAHVLKIDPAKLFVGGDSAGGNLAAVVSIEARDRADPMFAGQVLICPATDFALSHPSHSEAETSVLTTHSLIRWFRDHYLSADHDAHDWRASPAQVDDLAGLPPTYIVTAGADPLRDEGQDYAKRLEQAGVAVVHRSFPGQFHGFVTMGKLLPQANVAIAEIGDWLKRMS
ncbi:MAG: alpha/beta hydrolase [Rhodopseudomonas palustris]|nr:MAG: alpha/beta hydrolase [Rhodopseudomonas palustris]